VNDQQPAVGTSKGTSGKPKYVPPIPVRSYADPRTAERLEAYFQAKNSQSLG